MDAWSIKTNNVLNMSVPRRSPRRKRHQHNYGNEEDPFSLRLADIIFLVNQQKHLLRHAVKIRRVLYPNGRTGFGLFARRRLRKNMRLQ